MNRDFIKSLMVAIAIIMTIVIIPGTVLTQCNNDEHQVNVIILPLDGNDYVGEKSYRDHRLVPVFEDQNGLYYRIDFGTGGSYKIRVDANDERLTL